MYAKSNLKKNVREPFCTVKTNTKSMFALLQQSIFRAKIDEKSHVCWDIDFGAVFKGFHVLRTDRRTRREEEEALGNAKAW